MLLDEVEPDRGLVSDVLDHPVHAVLHCTATTRRPKKQAKQKSRGKRAARRNPQRRSENEDGAEGDWSPGLPWRKPSAGESRNDDEAAAAEEEGRWCMSAPAGGRPSRTRRLRSARGPQIRRRSERKQLRKRSIWERASASRALSFSLLRGRRLKNRQIIVLLTAAAATTRAPLSCYWKIWIFKHNIFEYKLSRKILKIGFLFPLSVETNWTFFVV